MSIRGSTVIQNVCLGTASSGRSSTKHVPTQALKQDSPTVETNPPPFQSFESILPCCCSFEVRIIFATLAPCLGSCKWFQWRTQCTPPCFDASTMVWTLGVPGVLGGRRGKRGSKYRVMGFFNCIAASFPVLSNFQLFSREGKGH